MGLFCTNEQDAQKEIRRNNSRIKEIREIIRQTGDEVTNYNASRVMMILGKCIVDYRSYKRVISRMDFMQQTLFYGTTVEC